MNIKLCISEVHDDSGWLPVKDAAQVCDNAASATQRLKSTCGVISGIKSCFVNIAGHSRDIR